MKGVLMLATALAILPLTALADAGLPVSGGVTTSGVGWRLDPFGSGKFVYHRGTDIAVPVGTPVHATRKGRVVFAGTHGGHGVTVIVEHDNGEKTLYGHNSSLTVRQGERVGTGSIIALSGNSGRSTGPHVHYEVLSGDRATAVAQGKRPAATRERPVDVGLRSREEQRLEDAVNSILRNINSSPVLSGTSGQGG